MIKKIMIIGWYGTETIGDRAILASLFKNLFEISRDIHISIGSIYPFHTKLTFLEDCDFYTRICNVPKEVIDKCDIIDARNLLEFKQGIKNSDGIIIGGGPFDEMCSMFMLQYAVKYAKKLKKKTMIYGCGSNILKSSKIKKAAKDIVNFSDLVILRDEYSKNILGEIKGLKIEKVHISIDPSVFSIVKYKQKEGKKNKKSYIAINLRDFPEIYRVSDEKNGIDINLKCFQIIKELYINNRNVKLVPMHYFDIGGDDRVILNRLQEYLGEYVETYNNPLTLEETLSCFYGAEYCIGMRFHSVVFQTILNGNNYILNYTSTSKGKTPGFIKQIGGEDFYNSRLINLQDENESVFEINDKCFSYNEDIIKEYENMYRSKIGEWMNV